jgi:hypothetical protein
MEKDENTEIHETNLSETKIILFENNDKREKKGREIEKKEKKKRVITISNSWNRYFNNKEIDFCKETQLSYLHSLLKNSSIKMHNNLLEEKKMHFLREQIQQKINNYRVQDIKKQIYDVSCFITLEYIFYKLNECNLDCFYCKEQVYIWYEISRESKQWTVERIDNTLGHNTGNIEIACLSCNLKRRCMYHERYLFTKQMKIVKKENI